MQGFAETLQTVGKGSWSSNGAASNAPKGAPPSSPSKDAGAWSEQLPQVAAATSQADKGSPNFSLLPQAQDSGGEESRPYFLDIFCGTAGVTSALKRYGAEAMGIAHVIDKRRMKGPAVKLDLTLPSSQNLVFEELRNGKVEGVMLAPPCGTSSKARNIPLRGAGGRRKQGPPPLRSETFPEGLPNLQGLNKTRVKQANKLYEFCRKVMDLCVELNILCIVENPETSLFWRTKWMLNVPQSFKWHVVHACR